MFVSLITTFQGFKKALYVLGFNSEQRMSQNCAHHFAGISLLICCTGGDTIGQVTITGHRTIQGVF